MSDMPTIVTFHSANYSPSPWLAHLVIDGKLFGVRFEDQTEEAVRERAKKWWNNETERQKRIVGSSELEPGEVTSDNQKPKFTSSWQSGTGGLTTPNHGMTGKVWLIHHAKKERLRVNPGDVETLLGQGWEKAGPKTQFRL